jgi:hypothetical protein
MLLVVCNVESMCFKHKQSPLGSCTDFRSYKGEKWVHFKEKSAKSVTPLATNISLPSHIGFGRFKVVDLPSQTCCTWLCNQMIHTGWSWLPPTCQTTCDHMFTTCDHMLQVWNLHMKDVVQGVALPISNTWYLDARAMPTNNLALHVCDLWCFTWFQTPGSRVCMIMDWCGTACLQAMTHLVQHVVTLSMQSITTMKWCDWNPAHAHPTGTCFDIWLHVVNSPCAFASSNQHKFASTHWIWEIQSCGPTKSNMLYMIMQSNDPSRLVLAASDLYVHPACQI